MELLKQINLKEENKLIITDSSNNSNQQLEQDQILGPYPRHKQQVDKIIQWVKLLEGFPQQWLQEHYLS